MGEMAGMGPEFPSHAYELYDNLVDLELSTIMTRASFSHETLHMSPPSISQLQIYQGQQHPEVHPLLKLETLGDASFENLHHSPPHMLPAHNTQLHLSDFELGPTWAPLAPPYTYPHLINNGLGHIPDASGFPPLTYA